MKSRAPCLALLLLCSLPSPASANNRLETIVVTGTRNERVVWDSPVRTEVITREDIERTHARDLKEALQYLPGVQLKQIHGKSGYEVWLQGLDADRVLVLVDGLPLTATTGSSVDISQLSLLEVDRIELVKGPTSAQYGSAAMGGVINVITRPITAGRTFSIAADGGSYGQQNAEGESAAINNHSGLMRGSVGSETWRARLSAASNQSDGIDPDPESWRRPGDATQRTTLDTRGEWHNGKASRAWVNVSQLEERNESRFDVWIDNRPSPHRKEEKADKLRFTAGLEHRQDNGAQWRLDGMQETLKNDTLKFSPTRSYDDRRADYAIAQVSSQWQSPALGPHVLLVGFDSHPESLEQTLDGISELQTVNGETEVTREGDEFLLQDDFFIDDQQELLSGIRYQKDSDFGDHVAPKLNYRFALPQADGSEQAFRVAWGAGYRVPNLKERYFVFDHSQLGYVVIGNPDLKPEESLGWQLGWSYRQDDQFTVDINFYHNRLRDFIQTDFDLDATQSRGDGVGVYRYLNLDRAKTQGFETIMSWQLNADLHLNAGYTFLDAKDRETGEELTRRARHQGSAGLDWRIVPEQLTTSVMLRTQSDELVSTAGQERSPGWAVVDTKLNFNVTPEWQVFGGIDNLFHRQRNFDDSFDFSPLEGRYVYLGTRLRWDESL